MKYFILFAKIEIQRPLDIDENTFHYSVLESDGFTIQQEDILQEA